MSAQAHTADRMAKAVAAHAFPVVTRERFQRAVKAAETAREAMSLMCSAGNDLPDEHRFGAIEDAMLESRALVRTMLSDLTGVSADRLEGIL